MTIQEIISNLVEKGFSYGKIAKEAGVSKATISRWHKGTVKANKTLKKIAKNNLVGNLALKQNSTIDTVTEIFKLISRGSSIDGEIEYYEKKLAELKAQKEAEKWKFTEDEKVILRNIDKQYKWLGRDAEGTLWFYDTKPAHSIGYGNAKYIDLFNHLFRCIKIQDEPCEFRKFI